MSVAHKGVPKPVGFGAKLSSVTKGIPKPHTRGKFSSSWRGGVSKIQKGLRATPEYRDWRNAVLKRDNGECVKCGSKDRLHVDHIIPFASVLLESEIIKYMGAIFDIDNGRTLCFECHRNTPTYTSRLNFQVEGRLILAIKQDWIDNGSKGNLADFYLSQMERIISGYKDKNLPHE